MIFTFACIIFVQYQVSLTANSLFIQNPNTDPQNEYNKKLSAQHVEAVKNYFIMNGISTDRIVTVGNDSSNPVVENDTEEYRVMNRRTDVSFKIIEQ